MIRYFYIREGNNNIIGGVTNIRNVTRHKATEKIKNLLIKTNFEKVINTKIGYLNFSS